MKPVQRPQMLCSEFTPTLRPWLFSTTDSSVDAVTMEHNFAAYLQRSAQLTTSGCVHLKPPFSLCVSCQQLTLHVLEFSPQAVSCTAGNRGHMKCSFSQPEDTKPTGQWNFWRDNSGSFFFFRGRARAVLLSGRAGLPFVHWGVVPVTGFFIWLRHDCRKKTVLQPKLQPKPKKRKRRLSSQAFAASIKAPKRHLLLVVRSNLNSNVMST